MHAAVKARDACGKEMRYFELGGAAVDACLERHSNNKPTYLESRAADGEADNRGCDNRRDKRA